MIPAIGSEWSKDATSTTRLADTFCVHHVIAVPPGGRAHPRYKRIPRKILAAGAGALVAVGSLNSSEDLTFILVSVLESEWTP